MTLADVGPLLLVGCGKMGAALVSGWLEGGLAEARMLVVEPNRDVAAALGVPGVAALSEVADDFQPAVVVFAVKPQVMDQVIAPCRRFSRPEVVFLSIAAGTPIAAFESSLGAQAAVVRAMPNTPAAVHRGMSVLTANRNASAAQRATCESLLAAVGEVAWVEDEALIDPVTAVSGGGPAYVFLLVETLARAGVEAGLPEDLALRLARVTVAGSGELLRQTSEAVATLRENVTSPGGTTQEALKVLMAEDGLQPLMTRAIAAATRRGRALAS